MTAAAYGPYLLRRGNSYSFRRVVPRDLAHRFRRREVKIALGTCDLSIARRRARIMANRFEEVSEMLNKTPELTKDQIDEFVRRYMARQWAI